MWKKKAESNIRDMIIAQAIAPFITTKAANCTIEEERKFTGIDNELELRIKFVCQWADAAARVIEEYKPS